MKVHASSFYFRSLASIGMALVGLLALPAWAATTKSVVFETDFDSSTNAKKIAMVYGAELVKENARSGDTAIRLQQGESSLRTSTALSEQGTLELWIKPSGPDIRYEINVLVSPRLNDDAAWVSVGTIKGKKGSEDYLAKRISIDDPGKKYLRLDAVVENGTLLVDDLRVEKILLGTALQKNQEKVISEVLDKLRSDKDYQVQADALRALGVNYAAQIDVQRQYLEYANGIYSSVTLVLATSERSKMANPLAYHTFKQLVEDVNKVASPIQKARVNSLIKPLGDIATTSLNIMTGGTYAAFAEPFKTIVATAFDRSSYEKAGIDRKSRKFAEKEGLATYTKTEQFLSEIERELTTVTALDKDLIDIQRELDKYRKDLDKHLQSALIDGGLGKGQENYNRVMSKDENVRAEALKQITDYFLVQAESYQNHSSSNTQFLQFMMRATSTIEESQLFKERFNQIAATVITYYDKFDRSIAPDQNPFSGEADRKAWEERAKKVRSYIKESKAAFAKAYM